MRPNNIKGPVSWQLDVSLSRTFQFGEAQRVEFRAEAFDATNSLRRGNPQTNVGNRRIGEIRSGQDARIMQFALQYFL